MQIVASQVDLGAAWLQDNEPVAQASKVLTPVKIGVGLGRIFVCWSTINVCMVESLHAGQTTSHCKIQCTSQVQELLINVQWHNFWRFSIFQVEGCTHRCIQQHQSTWKDRNGRSWYHCTRHPNTGYQCWYPWVWWKQIEIQCCTNPFSKMLQWWPITSKGGPGLKKYLALKEELSIEDGYTAYWVGH